MINALLGAAAEQMWALSLEIFAPSVQRESEFLGKCICQQLSVRYLKCLRICLLGKEDLGTVSQIEDGDTGREFYHSLLLLAASYRAVLGSSPWNPELDTRRLQKTQVTMWLQEQNGRRLPVQVIQDHPPCPICWKKITCDCRRGGK